MESSVTAPVCARARPFRVAPVCRAMLVRARTSPIKVLFTPRVADDSTLHHILHGSPPITDAPSIKVRVDADLKIQTPEPARVRFSVSRKAVAQ